MRNTKEKALDVVDEAFDESMGGLRHFVAGPPTDEMIKDKDKWVGIILEHREEYWKGRIRELAMLAFEAGYDSAMIKSREMFCEFHNKVLDVLRDI